MNAQIKAGLSGNTLKTQGTHKNHWVDARESKGVHAGQRKYHRGLIEWPVAAYEP
jgi:hypothetical protein